MATFESDSKAYLARKMETKWQIDMPQISQSMSQFELMSFSERGLDQTPAFDV